MTDSEKIELLEKKNNANQITILWNDAANWSAASGGAGGAGVLTNSDDVFFDANSPACTLAQISKGIQHG